MLILKKRYTYISVLLAVALFPAWQAYAVDSTSKLDKILALPEEKLDIGIAALTLAKEIYPDLDIKAYSAKIDSMAAKVRALTQGSTDPDFRVRALNTYLYQIEGIGYDKADPNARKIQNRYLNGIISTKKGACVTMPLLYLAVAQRLGYPVYPVSVPQHFILRYVDPRLAEQNIEATSGGGNSPDDEYRHVLQISARGVKSGAYLRTMTYREFLADLVSETAISWAMQRDYKKAIHYLEICAKMNPKSPEIQEALGKVYINFSRTLHPDIFEEEIREYRMKASVCFNKADELGIVKLSDQNYMEEQEKAQEEYRKKQN